MGDWLKEQAEHIHDFPLQPGSVKLFNPGHRSTDLHLRAPEVSLRVRATVPIFWWERKESNERSGNPLISQGFAF
ncbi:hypothetical protein GCM10027580_15860 [Corynebacterium faecale]